MDSDLMKLELARVANGAHALAIQILGNPDDAADAVHDSFATALQRPAAYDALRGPFRPWFLRVVRNRCLDLLRSRRPADPLDESLPSAMAGPEQALQDDERDHEIHQALTRLNLEQRQIVMVRDYMDLTYAEIASVLEIAPGTVMSRLHRARLALKRELTAYAD